MPQPPIFLINLDRDAEKLARMSARLKELGLEFERFSAVLGAALAPDELQRYRPHEDYWLERRPFALGEIGNVLSHRALMREIVARGIPYAVVLEDDTTLSDDFADLLKALPAMSDRYEVIKLEGLDWCGHYRQRRLGTMGERGLFLPRYPAVGCAGYFVTQEGARKLGEAVEVVLEPFDHTLTDYARHDLRFAELFPHPVKQADAMSEISASRINVRQYEPTLQFRLRKKAHKMMRSWRQKMYEARRLGMWTLWTEPETTTRSTGSANAHVAAHKTLQ